MHRMHLEKEYLTSFMLEQTSLKAVVKHSLCRPFCIFKKQEKTTGMRYAFHIIQGKANCFSDSASPIIGSRHLNRNDCLTVTFL